MDRFDRPRQALAISLAFLAGFVDATGFLSADRYFVSFMSGNTTRLGVDLARDRPSALVLALLIAGFVAGVAGGSVVAIRAGGWRKPAVLGTVAALLLAAAIAAQTRWPGYSLALMVLAMGALNNTFQRDGEIAVGLTYMTGALVRLGQAIGAALCGQRRNGWPGYLLLWLGLAAGAAAGAGTYLAAAGATLWLAATAALVLTMLAWQMALREKALESDSAKLNRLRR